ncbi:protein SLOW GREEN 1, chloroplastic [Malania oleifera]|uniref:protein SLOW GREEN 1, chloroplastic n=1 Tax=Malania oleifera TaxID=397392 RepID=UPI0025AE9741|nr:protein SLOW GREEN 1, chloroplastic [Malania oleifera]
MGSSSLSSSSSLCALPQHQNIKFSKRGMCIVTPKPPPISSLCTYRSLSVHSKFQSAVLFPLIKLWMPTKSSHLFSYSTSRRVPRGPTSNPYEKVLKFLSEKLVVLLVGSFIFMGCLGTRPVLALPTQKSSYSENTEEKRETQNERSEDEEMYVKILEEDPRNVEALKVVLYGKMRKRKTKEAVEYVERLIDAEPDEVEWRLLQALCYEMMEHLSKAKRLFKEILEERPLLLRALHGLAMVMHKNHEGPAVFEMLNKALEVARREKRVSEERNIRILIAQMHVVKGDLEGGLKNFQVLVDENPRDFRPYLCQGIIYSLLDRKKEAEEYFETYHSLVPKEFPQRGFLDDVVLTAKRKSRGQLEEEFGSEFSYRK